MKEKNLAEFTLSDGTTFLVEVEEPEDSAIERVALQKAYLKAPCL